MKQRARSVSIPEPDAKSHDRFARIRAYLIGRYGESAELVFMNSPDALPEVRAAFEGFIAGWDSALKWVDNE